MWEVRIEPDEEDVEHVKTVFLVNTETGERDRQERLGRYLDHLRGDDGFNERELIEIYLEEAQDLANKRNRDL